MDATKYDNTLDALKMTESEYRLEVTKGSRHVTEAQLLGGQPPTTSELKQEARDWVDDHEYFDGVDGATFGAIVEWADADDHELTQWLVEREAMTALRKMAREAMVLNIVQEARDIKYTTEGGSA